jgi:purine-binding chemotaxis protein CheW
MARRGAARRDAVDWAALRRRVEQAGRALDQGTTLAPERARAVLEERARALARPAAEPADRDRLDVVIVTMGAEAYALESRFVFEVFRSADLARLPGSPAPWYGVAAWRGELLRVLDLRPLLGIPPATAGGSCLIVVLGDQAPAFGLVVDGVEGIRRLAPGEVRAVPEVRAAAREFVRGITAAAELVLEGPALLRRYGAGA